MKDLLDRYGRWLEIGLLLILIGAAFAFGWNYAHKDTLIAKTQLQAAQEKIRTQQQTLDDLASHAQQAKAEEAAARDRERKAGETLNAFIQSMPKKQNDFVKQTTEIAKKPDCVVLTEHLCPAAMGY